MTDPSQFPSTIRGVVFDLDGLMFDTEALFFRVASEMLRARGKVFTIDIMRAMIGRQPAASGLAFPDDGRARRGSPRRSWPRPKERFEGPDRHRRPADARAPDPARSPPEARAADGGRHVVGPDLLPNDSCAIIT